MRISPRVQSKAYRLLIAAMLLTFASPLLTRAQDRRRDDVQTDRPQQDPPVLDEDRGPNPNGFRSRRSPRDVDGPRRFGRERGGPGRQGNGGPPPWRKLTDEDRKKLLGFIKEHFPRMWVDLNHLRENNPERFRRLTRRVLPEIMRIAKVYKNNPPMGTLIIRERRLDMQIRRMATRFRRSADPDEKRRLRKQLRESVGEVFDVQLKRRALEISTLESKLAELKNRLAEQEEMRDQMIQQRMREITKPPRTGAEAGNQFAPDASRKSDGPKQP